MPQVRVQPDGFHRTQMPRVRNQDRTRMLRRVLIAVLTFAAADIALVWVVSRWHSIAVRSTSGTLDPCGVYELTAHGGAVRFTHGQVRREAMAPGECSVERRARAADQRQKRRVRGGFLGFEYDCVRRTDELLDEDPPLRRMAQVVTVRLPCWMLLNLCIAYPGLVLVRNTITRRRRNRPGLCVSCGYNLTGNVSGICPECGSAIVNSTRSNRSSEG